MIQNFSREQVMTDSVLTHIAHKKHSHEVWLNRQKQQKKIIAQDCYGVQKKEEHDGLDSD